MKKLYLRVIGCFNGVATDKQQHFIICLILSSLLGTVFGLLYGFLITISIALFKECIVDALIMKDRADIEDIEYDFYGASGGIVLLVVEMLLIAIFK